MLLQAALGFPDHEVVELTLMDRRWQMVLDCTGIEEPLCSEVTCGSSIVQIGCFAKLLRDNEGVWLAVRFPQLAHP
jgi:hypothetical protein